jgi:hypothetical protein
MVLVAQGLSYAGGEVARLVQASFVALAGAVALTVLPSRRPAGVAAGYAVEALFQHRYDYRGRMAALSTDTMGRAGATAAPLRERIVQAVAGHH